MVSVGAIVPLSVNATRCHVPLTVKSALVVVVVAYEYDAVNGVSSVRHQNWNDEIDAGAETPVIATDVAAPPDVVVSVSAVADPSGAEPAFALIVQLVLVQTALSSCSE
jgi:hypothetical protein